MTSQYERELRHVLAGIPAGVEAVIKSCSVEEKERMRLVLNRPFLVVRAAGSGIEGSGDLLALRGDISFPIEVKTTKGKKIYLSGSVTVDIDSLKGESLLIDIGLPGANLLEGTIEVRRLGVHIQGGTRVVLKGRAKEEMIFIKGVWPLCVNNLAVTCRSSPLWPISWCYFSCKSDTG